MKVIFKLFETCENQVIGMLLYKEVILQVTVFHNFARIPEKKDI